MRISLVIPTYNEEKRIKEPLQKVREYVTSDKHNKYEVIIVDDGSKDNTVQVVDKLLKKMSKQSKNARWVLLKSSINKGKGSAVRLGMLHAKGDIIVFSDADLSTPLSSLEKAISHIQEGFDVVIGSRAIKGSRVLVYQPMYRVFLGKCFNMLVRLLTVHGIHDTQCGFKAFKKVVVTPIFSRQTLERFGFDVEILFIAQKLHLKIKEMPVDWSDSGETRVNPLKDSWRMLVDLFEVRKKYTQGKYRI